MATEWYKDHRFSPESEALIERMVEIVTDYDAQGLTLTLRQLYYRLVAADIVPNTDKSYDRIGRILGDARLAGLVDWNAIEDRVRQPWVPSAWDSVKEIVETALRSFKLDRRADQDTYVELWVEKDALSGVLRPLAGSFDCVLSVNRGYSSLSAMYEAARRFKRAVRNGQSPVIVYIGDFDPSGEDMVRDVRERLEMFNVSVVVEKIALTMDQIRKHKPPPNPAKMTDSRAAEYVRVHGKQSWEVDALPPRELQNIVRAALRQHTDQERYDAIVARENKERIAAAKKLGIKLGKEEG